jgi:hypothetical protein
VQTATESIVSGTAKTPGARRGDSARTKGAHRHVLVPRQPAHLHERPRDDLRELRCRVRSLHERGADENGAGPRELRRSPLCAAPDPALGYDDPVLWSRSNELELAPSVDLECRQITGVDADRICAKPDRALELFGVMRLDKRVQPGRGRGGHQTPRRLVVQVAEEEQDRIGPCGPGDAYVLVCREEAFREQRNARALSRCP